jgi:hypothetical protein
LLDQARGQVANGDGGRGAQDDYSFTLFKDKEWMLHLIEAILAEHGWRQG